MSNTALCMVCRNQYGRKRPRLVGVCGCQICSVCVDSGHFRACPICKWKKSFAQYTPVEPWVGQQIDDLTDSLHRVEKDMNTANEDLQTARNRERVMNEEINTVKEELQRITTMNSSARELIGTAKACSCCKGMAGERQLRICQTCGPLAAIVDSSEVNGQKAHTGDVQKEVNLDMKVEMQLDEDGKGDISYKEGTGNEDLTNVVVCATCCLDGVHKGHQTISYLSHLFMQGSGTFNMEDTNFVQPGSDDNGIELYYKIEHSEILGKDMETVRKRACLSQTLDGFQQAETDHKRWMEKIRDTENAFNKSISVFSTDIKNLHRDYAAFADSLADKSSDNRDNNG